MNPIISFLNEPIVLTILSLVVGGFLLNLIADRRARQDKIREKAIELLTEVGNDINIVIGRTFGYLRSQNVRIAQNSILTQDLSNLFAKRMSVQIRSKAYLNSEEFFPKYDILIWELRRIIDQSIALSNEFNLEEVVENIQNQKIHLGEIWPLDTEQIKLEDFEPPFNELISWTDMVFHRATYLLSTHLRFSLK